MPQLCKYSKEELIALLGKHRGFCAAFVSSDSAMMARINELGDLLMQAIWGIQDQANLKDTTLNWMGNASESESLVSDPPPPAVEKTLQEIAGRMAIELEAISAEASANGFPETAIDQLLEDWRQHCQRTSGWQ